MCAPAYQMSINEIRPGLVASQWQRYSAKVCPFLFCAHVSHVIGSGELVCEILLF